MNSGEVHIEVIVHKAKCFDELGEMAGDIRELYDLVPEHLQGEADAIIDRVKHRLMAWTQINPEDPT